MTRVHLPYSSHASRASLAALLSVHPLRLPLPFREISVNRAGPSVLAAALDVRNWCPNNKHADPDAGTRADRRARAGKQTDTHTGRQTDRHSKTCRERERRPTNRQTKIQTNRQPETQRERQREREGKRERLVETQRLTDEHTDEVRQTHTQTKTRTNRQTCFARKSSGRRERRTGRSTFIFPDHERRSGRSTFILQRPGRTVRSTFNVHLGVPRMYVRSTFIMWRSEGRKVALRSRRGALT